MTLIIGLIVIGVLLLIIEMVIPGGIVGTLGAICMLVAIVIGFTKSIELGVILLIISLIIGATALWAWAKYFPDSPLGKQIFLDKDAKDWQGYDENTELLGKTGVAHTDLRPSGMATINDERVNVVTQGELIDRDELIKVIEIEGNRIVVAMVPAAKEQVSSET